MRVALGCHPTMCLPHRRIPGGSGLQPLVGCVRHRIAALNISPPMAGAVGTLATGAKPSKRGKIRPTDNSGFVSVIGLLLRQPPQKQEKPASQVTLKLIAKRR
jgi:hypothetical protein